MVHFLNNIRCLLAFLLACSTHAMEPITLGWAVGGIVAGITSLYQITKCKMFECCDEPWLATNVTSNSGRTLRMALEERVYGQHIAIELVTEHVRNHLASKPSKALVLSFHGSTGVGKTHISRVLAETMYKKGMESQFVHLLVSTRDFPINEKGSVYTYRVMLQEWIQGNLTKCSRSLFIFDEVDKIPIGVLDGLSSFLDYNAAVVNGADPRNAIFIFLSNTGKSKIDEITYQAWENGRTRESLVLEDFQQVIQLHALNQDDSTGMYHSNIILKELVDMYIPFLPLERRHIEACTRDYLREHNFTLTDDAVAMVATNLDYFPQPDGLFSTTGCKRIRERVVGLGKWLRKGSHTEKLKDDEL